MLVECQAECAMYARQHVNMLTGRSIMSILLLHTNKANSTSTTQTHLTSLSSKNPKYQKNIYQFISSRNNEWVVSFAKAKQVSAIIMVRIPSQADTEKTPNTQKHRIKRNPFLTKTLNFAKWSFELPKAACSSYG
jgi:hypothetical protein